MRLTKLATSMLVVVACLAAGLAVAQTLPSSSGSGVSAANVLNSQNNLSALNCTASEQDAFTYTLPGGTLTTSKYLEIVTTLTPASIDANATVRFYFGSTSTSSGGSLLNPPWSYFVNVVPSTNTAGHIFGSYLPGTSGGASPILVQVTATTADITANQTVKMTVQCTDTVGTVARNSWRVVLRQ